MLGHLSAILQVNPFAQSKTNANMHENLDVPDFVPIRRSQQSQGEMADFDSAFRHLCMWFQSVDAIFLGPKTFHLSGRTNQN